MKDRYLLFAGHHYYPGGGWEDYLGSFESVEAAKVEAESQTPRLDWADVVDLESREAVLRCCDLSIGKWVKP